MQHTQIKLVDGEIWIHSPSVMLGYYKDADATAEMLSDRWLKTGDLGRFDEKGALYLTGRKKNLIVLSSGENISPEYIEQLLRESESVREVCVSEKNDHILAEIYPTDAVLEKDAAGARRPCWRRSIRPTKGCRFIPVSWTSRCGRRSFPKISTVKL